MRKTLLDILNDVKSGIDYEKEREAISLKKRRILVWKL